jgi:hypothetical protein
MLILNFIFSFPQKGLKASHGRRVLQEAKHPIPKRTADKLRAQFNLTFKYKKNEELVSFFKLIQGHFKSERNLCKCVDFKVALR